MSDMSDTSYMICTYELVHRSRTCLAVRPAPIRLATSTQLICLRVEFEGSFSTISLSCWSSCTRMEWIECNDDKQEYVGKRKYVAIGVNKLNKVRSKGW